MSKKKNKNRNHRHVQKKPIPMKSAVSVSQNTFQTGKDAARAAKTKQNAKIQDAKERFEQKTGAQKTEEVVVPTPVFNTDAKEVPTKTCQSYEERMKQPQTQPQTLGDRTDKQSVFQTQPESIKKQSFDQKNKYLFAWAMAATLAVIAVILILIMNVSANSNARIDDTNASVAKVEAVQAEHVHDWTLAYGEPIHHDAVTHEVEHDAVYETVTVNHTICNVCHAVIDGETDSHSEKTGHVGYTTNVPTQETRQVSEAWIEVVEDSPAYDEETPYYVCSECGQTRNVNEAK